MANMITKVATCTYKPTNDSWWTPVHLWMSDRSQKQASANTDLQTFASGIMTISYISLLMELSINDKTILWHVCIYVAGFGKSGHSYNIIVHSLLAIGILEQLPNIWLANNSTCTYTVHSYQTTNKIWLLF